MNCICVCCNWLDSGALEETERGGLYGSAEHQHMDIPISAALNRGNGIEEIKAIGTRMITPHPRQCKQERPDKSGEWSSFVACIHSGDRPRLERHALFKRYKSYAERRFNECLIPKRFDGDLHAKNLWIVAPKSEHVSIITAIKTILGPRNVCYKAPTSLWDGYKEQPCVIWSPCATWIKTHGSDLKQVGDRYQFRGETRRGALKINPIAIVIVITSQSPKRILCAHGVSHCDRFEFDGLARRYRVVETQQERNDVLSSLEERLATNLEHMRLN